MASLEELKYIQSVSDRALAQAKTDTQTAAYKQVAQAASDLYLKGDVKGAVATLAQADPELARDVFKTVATTQNPELQGQIEGAKEKAKLTEQQPFKSTPGQVAETKAEAKTTQEAKPRIFKDANSPTGFSMATPQGVFPFDQYGAGSTTTPQPTATKPTEEKPVKLRANEDIDSAGQKVLLTPQQQSVIKDARKTFDSETKDIVKGLDAAQKSIDLIDTNTPGARTVEALTTLKAAIGGRVGQQEFQAYGKGMGILNQVDNAISEARGKGMSPKTQEFMSKLVRTSADVLSKEFDQHLTNAVQRNPEVDGLILKKRLVSEHGPSVYKDTVNQVSKLPAQHQAAFNWAHDHPSDPRAKAIFQSVGAKIGAK